MSTADVEIASKEQTTESVPAVDDRRRKGRLALVALLLIVLLTCCCVIWSLLREVPDVVGMTEAEAQQTLEDAGFKSDPVFADGSSDVSTGAGMVIAQDPLAGTRHMVGTVVTITIASGSEAEEESTEETSTYSTPWTGSESDNDESDTGGSSGGSGATGPVVPMAQNMTEAQARAVLEGAGYRMVVGGYGPTTAGVVEGKTYFQDPAPGTVLAKGSTVTVWVSTGAPETGVPYPQPVSP